MLLSRTVSFLYQWRWKLRALGAGLMLIQEGGHHTKCQQDKVAGSKVCMLLYANWTESVWLAAVNGHTLEPATLSSGLPRMTTGFMRLMKWLSTLNPESQCGGPVSTGQRAIWPR